MRVRHSQWTKIFRFRLKGCQGELVEPGVISETRLRQAQADTLQINEINSNRNKYKTNIK
jgi:hypothetical protein